MAAARCVGGAIASFEPITVRESVFRFNNTAGNVGGAIFLNHSSSNPSSIINSQFYKNKTILLQEVIFGIHPEGGAIALGGYGNQDTLAKLTANTIVRNGGKSQIYSQGFASGVLRNNIVGTNDDLLPIVGFTVHQINCNGSFSGVAGSVQSTEGSASSSCTNNVVDYAELNETTGTHQFECADPSNDGAATNDLGKIEPQDFE